MLAYDAEVYFSLMAQYNAAIWPAQAVAWVLGVIALGLLFHPSRSASVAIGMIIGACWLWTGVAFHWVTFAPLNFAAPVFAGVFVLEALLIALVIGSQGDLRFRVTPTASGWAGLALSTIALGVYPILAPLTGIAWAQSPMFGVSSPTTVLFTLGMLLLAQPRMPWMLAVIPVLWTLYAGAVAWVLEIPQDMILPVAGGITMALAIYRKREA